MSLTFGKARKKIFNPWLNKTVKYTGTFQTVSPNTPNANGNVYPCFSKCVLDAVMKDIMAKEDQRFIDHVNATIGGSDEKSLDE